MPQRQRGRAIKEWWYREMVTTTSPLTDRLVLFWHNHFTSPLRKVQAPQSMYRKQRIFRTHAHGNFREMLHQIATDPAMLVYLDGVHSERR